MQRISYTVLLILITLASCSSGGQYNEMRQRLDALNALNRADSVLTVKERDEAQALADYFDSHGTPNDQMLAHYLLGRCYADMREAPMALHCYQEAITRADTTAKDCDFAQLSRVYGQSSAIFYQQGLYRNAMEYDDLSAKYGWLGKDKLNALRSYAMKAAAYDQLQMKDSAILIYTDAIRQMKAYKYNKVAAGFSGAVARMLVDNGEMAQALPYLQDYEQHSGYFDSLGNIVRGREIYYCWKGLSFLKSNQLDSAEYFFRKELHDGKDYGNQNSGSRRLAQLFLLSNRPDSAAKYALYAYDMNDSVYAQRATQEVEQSKAMYDYTRNRELAQQEKQKAESSQRLLCYIAILIILVSIVVGRIIYFQRKEKQRQLAEYEALLSSHVDLQAEVMQLRLHKENYDILLHEKERLDEQLGTTKTEIEELQASKGQLETLIAQKEDELEQQKGLLDSFKQVKERLQETDKQLKETTIYKMLSDKASRGIKLSDAEWKQLERFVIDYLPEFNRIVTSRQYGLTTRLYRICILIRLQFPNKAIGYMMGTSFPSISQACPIISKKLFGEYDNHKDLAEKLSLLC